MKFFKNLNQLIWRENARKKLKKETEMHKKTKKNIGN